MRLTLTLLKEEAGRFAKQVKEKHISELYGTTDGKTIGTFVEDSFHENLKRKYAYERGSAASGLDFPNLGVDVKATSVKQPQSSCPYKSAREKVYGLGYNLLIFVYDKSDIDELKKTVIDIKHAIFLSRKRTADYQTTRRLREILNRNGSKDDIYAFLEDIRLPLDDVGRRDLVEKISNNPPTLGYLTISSALQWRLQYSRVIEFAKEEKEGVESVM